MAVAYESIGTTAGSSWDEYTNGEFMVITKPEGVIAGDLLIAHISETSSGTSVGSFTPVGADWVSLGVQESVSGSSAAKMQVFARIATSADVSATIYNFMHNTDLGGWSNGVIYRLSGPGGIDNIQIAFDTDSSTSSPVFANTVTPNFADSLVLFLLTSNANQNSGSVTAYAVTNDDPTWTERYDLYGADTFGGTGDGDGLMSGATASRPETTATGDSSCTLVNFGLGIVGAIVVIPPVGNIIISPEPLILTLTIPRVILSGDVEVIASPLVLTFSIPSATVTTAAAEWTNQTKNPSTWTNQDKS